MGLLSRQRSTAAATDAALDSTHACGASIEVEDDLEVVAMRVLSVHDLRICLPANLTLARTLASVPRMADTHRRCPTALGRKKGYGPFPDLSARALRLRH